MKLKVPIVMAGGGACGKTTTTHTFVQGEPDERKAMMVVETTKGMVERKVNWTIYDNCAATGNHNSGTDSNTGPGLVKAAFFECLKVSDITITDGMISSPKWALMCNEAHEIYRNMHVLVVHFDLSAEELLKRLAGRRGVTKDSIRERMYPRCVQLVRRAELLVEHFEGKLERCIPLTILGIDKYMSPEDIVYEMDEALEEIFAEHEEDYYA